MSPEKDNPTPPQGHNHKVVLVYASYHNVLSASTFRLLHQKSFYDAILKAYLESAYQALRYEVDAAAKVTEEGSRNVPVLPDTFKQLGDADYVKTLLPYTLSLTTLAHIGVVLATRQDFKDAMRGDFAAVWDPESFLAANLLRKLDVTSSLELITNTIEVIKLASWLDFYLDIGNLGKLKLGRHRVTIRGDILGIQRAAIDWEDHEMYFTTTFSGLTVTTQDPEHFEDIRLACKQKKVGNLIAVEKTLIPILSSDDSSRLMDKLQRIVTERRISVGLTMASIDLQSASGTTAKVCKNGCFCFDLDMLIAYPDEGRSDDRFASDLELLQVALRDSRVHEPRVSFLLLGGAMNDACATSLMQMLEGGKMLCTPLKLLDLLCSKDSHRFGDEPVHLSKVRGNPCQQVAIIGMSCRVPGADDSDELWQLLKDGKDMCETVSRRHLVALIAL